MDIGYWIPSKEKRAMEGLSVQKRAKSFENLTSKACYNDWVEKSMQNRKKIVDMLDEVNKLYLDEPTYQKSIRCLHSLLEYYKREFVLNDNDQDGFLSIFELGHMMNRIGKHKTHEELKEMMEKVGCLETGQMSYNDFLYLMLGKTKSVLHLTLKFEELGYEKKTPLRIDPPKRERRSTLAWFGETKPCPSLFKWRRNKEGRWVPNWPPYVPVLTYPQ